MSSVYRWWAALVVIVVVLQIAFAGFGAFDVAGKASDGTVDEDSFFDSFTLHAITGYLAVLTGLVLLLLAFLARAGRTRIIRTAILFGLLVIQVPLAWIGFEVPIIGALHPVNAMLIFGLSAWLVWDLWGGRVDRTAGVPTP